MADGDNPTRPRPPTPPAPGQPIPRLWKADPEPDDTEASPRKSRKERLAEEKEKAEEARAPAKSKAKDGSKGKAKSAKGEKKPKGALIEATPESETYEARQRARLLIGGGMLAIFGFGLVLLFRAIDPGTPPEQPSPDEGALLTASLNPTATASPAEQEAKILLASAQRLAKGGNTKGSIDVLNKVIKSYPKTATAGEAREALDRPSRNLPLFLDRPTVVASPTVAPAPPAEPPGAIVNASPAAAVKPGATADARIDLLPNSAETPRAPTNTVKVPTTPAGPAPKPLPAGFHARTEAGLHASGWPNQVVSDRDGATMVLIPAGTYVQGRDDGAPEEAPEHKVTLGAYYIDQHEATVRQFHFYLKETGGKVPAPRAAAKGEAAPPADAEELPVVNITAREAKAYCDWAGKRLPTEAQWEAAARTPDGRAHPWGANPADWSRPRVPRQIDPVMSFPLDQSPYGVFDLAGNAWEYTKDWYDPHYYRDLKGQLPPDPTGPATSRSRPPQVVVKGTSKTWSASAREGIKVDGKFPYVGFRGVLPLETPQATAAPGANQGGGSPLMKQNPGGIVPF